MVKTVQVYHDQSNNLRSAKTGKKLKGDAPAHLIHYVYVNGPLSTARFQTEESKKSRALFKPIDSQAVEYMHQAGNAIRKEKGVGFANLQTAKMYNRLAKLDHAMFLEFAKVKHSHNAHYIKYSPKTHEFKLYNYKSMKLGTFKLPASIKQKKKKKAAVAK